MSYRYPYASDSNVPPGMPQAYPYGPPPLPTSNPLLPPGFAPTIDPMPNAPAYVQNIPSGNSHYFLPSASNNSFPHAPPQKYPNYPSNSNTISPYPSATSYSSTSPYPSSASYSSTSPYTSARSYSSTSPYPSVTSSTSPYPSTTSTFPEITSNASYPPSGSSYPLNTFTGAVPYPSSVSHVPTGVPSYPASNTYAGVYPSSNFGKSGGYQANFSQHRSNMAQLYAGEGTVKPYPAFDPKQDAEVLRKAMKGFGTDEKSIINVLAKRSNYQRVYIAVAFKQLYGKDLIDDLKSELSGNFEDVIIALMTPTNDYLASEVHKSISGIGTDEDVLIEILCTRTNQEIWAINEAYQSLYGKSLESDIKSDTSGHFQRLLVSICTGARSEAPADETRAKQNAHALFSAGVGQWGTDESVFNSILVAESFQQLALTFYEYQKLAGHTVAEAIDKEMSGDLKKGMLAIARTVENRPFYFAEKLYKAMKVGLGTDDRTLIRIVVTRCEVDMVQIKAEYERNYGKPLADAIHGDTSGDYRRVLIALVNGY